LWLEVGIHAGRIERERDVAAPPEISDHGVSVLLLDNGGEFGLLKGRGNWSSLLFFNLPVE
jgi:hypothetical protein